MRPSSRFVGLALASLLLAISQCALSQAYPSRPIRFIAPFPAGGGVDIVARLIGGRLTESLGQQIVVDNRPGATGIIGTQIAAQAAPDGYTLVMGNVATHAINVSMFKSLPYDPTRDFSPITLVARVPEILVVNPSLPAHTVKDLIALARQKPGQLNFGSAGTGSPPHMAAELFRSMAKINVVHVPYKGSTPALIDLMGGQISMYFSNILSAMRHVKAGKLRALGVTSATRSIVAPDVPTIAEAALPGYEAYNWYGILAPHATPEARIALLHDKIVAALRDESVHDRLVQSGAEVIGNSPAEFQKFIKSEIAKYARVVREAGLQPH